MTDAEIQAMSDAKAAEAAERAAAVEPLKMPEPVDLTGEKVGPQSIVDGPFLANERDLQVIHVTMPDGETWEKGKAAYRLVDPPAWKQWDGGKVDGDVANGGPIMAIDGRVAHVVVRGTVLREACPVYDKAVKAGVIPKRSEWKDSPPVVLVKAV